MKEPRVSFESEMTDEEAEASRNSGLKLQPSRTRLVNKQAKQDFQQQVMNTHKRLEGHLKDAYELGTEFTRLMSDTRVSDNIGPYDRSFEKEIVRKFIDYAITVNNDDQEKEGMGSVSLITLLLKTAFKLRDRINQLSYDNHLLERRIQHLEKSILSSETKTTDESK